MKCVVCGEPLHELLAPATTHPTCITFGEPGNEDPFTVLLRDKLTNIIEWGEAQNPRNHQVAIGPSELGELCDRRIGYRVAGIPHVDTRHDEWPATVGTAIHSWLQHTFESYMDEHLFPETEWLTETTLSVVDGVEGHCDLYSVRHKTVIDWKTKGPDVLRKIRKHGPLPGEVVQAQVYGYGFERAGVPVERVALVYLPRAGWLRDMFVWHAPYDPTVAEKTLDRVSGIALQILDLDVLNQSHRWEQVLAVPGDACGTCPWYDPNRDLEAGATDTGCPGR